MTDIQNYSEPAGGESTGSPLQDIVTDEDVEAAEKLASDRRLGQSRATAGDRDLRDAETFRALREQEKR